MRVVLSCRFDQQVLKRMEKDWEVQWLPPEPGRWGLPEADLIAALQGADVLVTEADAVTAKVLASSPQLKALIACRGTPVNVDLVAATAEGVLVANTPGRNTQAVAELSVALMIMIARQVVPAMEALRSGKWANSPRAWAYRTFQGYELGGRTAGLIGLGAIGRMVAKRLQAFNMKVIAHDPYVSQAVADTVGAQLLALDKLLPEADFISLHLHVTSETRGMIGVKELAMMKPTAFLINTGRAAVVMEEAILNALRQNLIAGAALDVYHQEPLPKDHPLLSFPNVVLLPHIGGATLDVIYHQSEIVEENLNALVAGRVPPFLFNPEVLKNPRLRFGFQGNG